MAHRYLGGDPSLEQNYEYIEGTQKTTPWKKYQGDEEMGWGETLVRGGQQFIPSTIALAEDVYEAVTNPVQTGEAVLNLASGALQHALPEGLTPEFLDPSNKELASAVGEYYVKKYGSEKGLKEAIATDPASVLGDLATVVMGGGGVVTQTGKLAKIPKIAETGRKITQASQYIEPLTLTAKAIGGTGYVGSQIAKHSAGLASGVGQVPLEQAYKAGLTGGEIQKQFLQNLKGEVPMEDALNIAKQNLEQLKIQKQEQYRQNQEKWKLDAKVLSFDDINKALSNAEKLVKFKGRIQNKRGYEVLEELRKKINEYKKLDPKQYHTAEGFDNLKKEIWETIENVSPEHKQANAVAKTVYHSVRNSISKQSPSYSKAMKDYTEASEIISEMERTLSLNPNATVDTALRKLQSLMRDNVQTNYGKRQELAKKLEDVGGKEFMPSLAGQSLSQVEPRGIQRATAIPTAGGAGYFVDPLAGATALGLSSPRISGRIANIAGDVMRRAKQTREKIPVSDEGIRGLLNLLYQQQQMQEVGK